MRLEGSDGRVWKRVRGAQEVEGDFRRVVVFVRTR